MPFMKNGLYLAKNLKAKYRKEEKSMNLNFLSSTYRNSVIDQATSGDVPVEYDDLINLSIGDPDINTPQLIIDRAFKDASNGHT